MAKKAVDPVEEQKAQAAVKTSPADAIDTAALLQDMRELRDKLDTLRIWSQGDMQRRYAQVLTMLKGVTARYEQDILAADEAEVNATKPGG